MNTFTGNKFMCVRKKLFKHYIYQFKLYRVKKLHVFVLKSFAGPFVLTFIITTFILLMQFLWKYIEDLVGKGLEIDIILKLLSYISASLIPMALPLAVLLAALMTFGNLGENYELLALKASGISLQRIMRPLLFVSFIISIGAFLFANNVVPAANLKMRTLLRDIKKQKSTFQISEGVFYNDIEGYSIKVEKKHPETGTLYQVMIYDHKDNKENNKVTLADSGIMKMTPNEDKLFIRLYNGYTYTEIQEEESRQNYNFPHRIDQFDEEQIVLDLSGFGLHRSDESLFKSHYQMMNLNQLESMQDSIENEIHVTQNRYLHTLKYQRYFNGYKLAKNLESYTPQDTSGALKNIPVPLYKNYYFNTLDLKTRERIVKRALNDARNYKGHITSKNSYLKHKKVVFYKHEVEWHRKFTLSLACFIFFFIGAPLGAIIRKGGFGTPVVISVVFFIVYYVISMLGENLVEDLVITPVQGMWGPNLIILPLGIFLTYKATTDSTILNIETYLNIFKKIKKLFYRKMS